MLEDEEKLNKDLIKLKKIEKEKAALQEAIASGNYKTKRDKVAAILNLYPKTRNSDIALALKFWELYQGEIYDGSDISPENMFKLERLTTIARLRAKIQNEYKLFLADEEIRNRRRRLEENFKEVMLEDISSLPLINVYADETGKQSEFLIIGSVWILDSKTTFSFSGQIENWKHENNWKKEFHFTETTKHEVDKVLEFVKFLSKNRSFFGFKHIAFRQKDSKRKIEEILRHLYRFLVLKGIDHELNTGRIALPRTLNLYMDKEDSLDNITIDELKYVTAERLRSEYGDKFAVNEIIPIDSKAGPYIQVADLISGAVNRRLNHKGPKGWKDEFADEIINLLDLASKEESEPEIDSSVYINV